MKLDIFDILSFAEVYCDPAVAVFGVVGSFCVEACPSRVAVESALNGDNAVGERLAVFIRISDSSVFIPAPFYFSAALLIKLRGGVGCAESEVLENDLGGGFACIGLVGGVVINCREGAVFVRNGCSGLTGIDSDKIACLKSYCSALCLIAGTVGVGVCRVSNENEIAVAPSDVSCCSRAGQETTSITSYCPSTSVAAR